MRIAWPVAAATVTEVPHASLSHIPLTVELPVVPAHPTAAGTRQQGVDGAAVPIDVRLALGHVSSGFDGEKVSGGAAAVVAPTHGHVMLAAFVRGTERATYLADVLGANRPVALEHHNLLLAFGDVFPCVDMRKVAALGSHLRDVVGDARVLRDACAGLVDINRIDALRTDAHLLEQGGPFVGVARQTGDHDGRDRWPIVDRQLRHDWLATANPLVSAAATAACRVCIEGRPFGRMAVRAARWKAGFVYNPQVSKYSQASVALGRGNDGIIALALRWIALVVRALTPACGAIVENPADGLRILRLEWRLRRREQWPQRQHPSPEAQELSSLEAAAATLQKATKFGQTFKSVLTPREEIDK
eukprot:scaffold27954_cov70-Phaeocystis_antarctica.AAC.2